MAFTVNSLGTHVRRAFGDEASIQISDDDIIRWTNAGMREILISHKVLKQKANTAITPGQYEYDISGLGILQIQTIRVGNRPVEFRSFQEFEDYIQEHDPHRNAKGQPRIWYKWGDTIGFWPTPDASVSGNIDIYYIARPTEVQGMTDEIGLPDEYFNRLVEYVLGQAYELDEDNENSGFKLGQFRQGLDIMAGDTDRPQNNLYGFITVLEEDSY